MAREQRQWASVPCVHDEGVVYREFERNNKSNLLTIVLHANRGILTLLSANFNCKIFYWTGIIPFK